MVRAFDGWRDEDDVTKRVAIDIGGTFTDLVLEDGARVFTKKVLTTPRAPEEAVMTGLRALLGDAGIKAAQLDVLVHGTTLATNAILERKGAKTALLATEGFRDVIEIAYESRYDQYDISIEKPVQLVPRHLRFTVPERVDAGGGVRRALDEAAVRALAPQLKAAGVGAVAVAFLHSYANTAHETRVREILAKELPEVAIALSCEVCPEIREYDRTSTTIANAYVQPLMARYLRRLERMLAEDGYRGPVYLMTSGGGLTTLDAAARFPIRLVESGPAGGAILASHLAMQAGEDKVVSFDMGGTTAKICLIEKGEPQSSRSFEVDRAARFLKGSGLPLRIPVIEMVEIGAGGGSIAKIDALGRIAVGPESAASEPGPAAYGRGGTRPTVTDADVVMGRIDPKTFAGGTIALDLAAARGAVDTVIGKPQGLGTDMAAYGIAEMVDETMASAARVHAVERGKAIAEHTMIAFGGAAPLHASRVAEKLGLARVIVPANAGVGSAVGFLRAPVAYEVVHSRYMKLSGFEPAVANGLVDRLAAEARAVVVPGAGGKTVREVRGAYMRYVGQGHEILITIPERPLTEADTQELRTRFEAAYAQLFARIIPGAAIEILSWSVVVSTEAERPARLPAAPAAAAPAPRGKREVFDAASGRIAEIPVYWRPDMAVGARIAGPALITEDETSTFVSRAFDATIDAARSIVLVRKTA
ncbi:MAG: hydantoinase/oxoprolinase family protein [Alphaproteobacteria bacterium]|nr:hydantoinase/oxoprolinase family protein [Alphaproteobacteria bacterium]